MRTYWSLLKPMTWLWNSHQVKRPFYLGQTFISPSAGALRPLGGPADVLCAAAVAEGCLNFGTLKVFEENKLVLKIKNQGKYDIAFK